MAIGRPLMLHWTSIAIGRSLGRTLVRLACSAGGNQPMVLVWPLEASTPNGFCMPSGSADGGLDGRRHCDARLLGFLACGEHSMALRCPLKASTSRSFCSLSGSADGGSGTLPSPRACGTGSTNMITGTPIRMLFGPPVGDGGADDSDGNDTRGNLTILANGEHRTASVQPHTCEHQPR